MMDSKVSDSESSTLSEKTSDSVEKAVYEDESQTRESPAQGQSLNLQKTSSNAFGRIASRLSTKSIVDPPPPPNGGFQAWNQVAMGWLVIFATWGWVNSYGAFQDYYRSTLTESASTISWIGAVLNWATFFVGAFSGRLLDAGYFLPTTIIGSILHVLGIFLTSISTKYWQLMLTQGIITGIGGGMLFTPAVSLIGTYFSSRRALALGITTTGNSVGGMIYPVLVERLLPKIGYGWTVRVLGFVNLAVLGLVVAFMRPRLPPRKSGPIIDLNAFKDLPYACLVASFFFVVWGMYYTFYYLASFGSEALKMPFSESTNIVILLNGSGFLARVIPALLADKFGPLNVVVPVVASLTVVSFTWLAVHSAGGLWVFTPFYGITSAAYQCVWPSTVASLTKDLDMLGTRVGMAFAVLSFAALTGPPIGGALQSSEGGRYVGAQAFAAASTAICFLFVIVARVAKGGWKLKVKC